MRTVNLNDLPTVEPAPIMAGPAFADELRALLPVLLAAVARIESALQDHADTVTPISTIEAAAIAGVSSQTCRNWVKKYKLRPCVRGRFQIDRRLFGAYLRDRWGR